MVSIALHTIVVLRCTSLACHLDHTALELALGGASDDHAFQHGLELLDGFGVGDMLVEDDGFKLFNGLVATTDLGDKLRLHHAASVGDGVVEREEMHRRDVDLVANRHPRQRHLRPQFSAVFGLVVGVLDDGLRLTSDARADFLVQVQGIQAFDVFLWMCSEVLVDEHRRTFVRRLLNNFLDGADAALGKAVVVFHRTVRKLDGTGADVHLVVKVDIFVVEEDDHRGNLKHRARFVAFGEGHVVRLLV